MFRQSLLVLKQILSYVKVKNFQVVSLKYKSDGDRRYYCDYCQHNYDKSIKGLVDAQINQELTAGYTYLNIANYFAQSNVALPGVHGFFMKMFYEELGHGFDFIKYQIKRGASVNLCPLNCSKPNKWNIATVFACALDMEKNIKEHLEHLYALTEEKADIDGQDFVQSYIKLQELSIQEMARYSTRARQLDKDHIGVYLFDRELHETHVRRDPPKVEVEIGKKFYS